MPVHTLKISLQRFRQRAKELIGLSLREQTVQERSVCGWI